MPPDFNTIEWVTHYDDGSEKLAISYDRETGQIDIGQNGQRLDLVLEHGEVQWLLERLAWINTYPPAATTGDETDG